MRGTLAQLPVGGGAAETCLAGGTAAAQLTDSAIPVPAAAYYYLVRGSPPYSPTACP